MKHMDAIETIPAGTGMTTEKVAELVPCTVAEALFALTALEAEGKLERYSGPSSGMTFWRERRRP